MPYRQGVNGWGCDECEVVVILRYAKKTVFVISMPDYQNVEKNK